MAVSSCYRKRRQHFGTTSRLKKKRKAGIGMKFKAGAVAAFVAIAGLLLLAGCQFGSNSGGNGEHSPSGSNGNQGSAEEEQVAVEDGYIVDISEDRGRVLITEYAASGEHAYINAIWFSVRADTKVVDAAGAKSSIETLQTGQRVKAWSNGPVAESYPMQTSASTLELLPPEHEALAKANGLAHALEAAARTKEMSMAWAVKSIALDEEQQLWQVELVETQSVDDPYVALIDDASGRLVVASNEAFRVFAPEPDSVVGSSFTVEGAARVFEATLNWNLEDGHNVLGEGYETASEGAPGWGQFQFTVEYEQASSPVLILTLFESSAEDGSPIHELLLPLKLDESLLSDAP